LELRNGHVGVLISLWLFLFAKQPKEFFLEGLKEVRTTNSLCGAQEGICRVNTIFSIP
jgi:hypothetical protein